MPTSLLFAVCVLIWGTTWFAITAQLTALAPELGVALRFALAAALLFGWCVWRCERLRFAPRQHGRFFVQGLAGFSLSYLCVYHAERFIVSGVVAVAYAASPLIVMGAARLVNATPMSRRVALGGSLGLGGIALIFGHELARLGASTQGFTGVALAMAAVLLSAVATLAAQRYQREGISGWAPLAWSMAYGGLGSFVAMVVASLTQGRSWSIDWSMPFAASFLYLTVAGSILTFGAYYALVLRLGPARAGYIGVLTPIVALLVSSVLEGFAWTGGTVAGVALALAGHAVAMWQPRREVAVA